MHAVEQINPEITEALRSMHKDKKNHIEDIMDMLMKSESKHFLAPIHLRSVPYTINLRLAVIAMSLLKVKPAFLHVVR